MLLFYVVVKNVYERFSKSTELPKANKISLEISFKARDS